MTKKIILSIIVLLTVYFSVFTQNLDPIKIEVTHVSCHGFSDGMILITNKDSLALPHIWVYDSMVCPTDMIQEYTAISNPIKMENLNAGTVLIQVQLPNSDTITKQIEIKQPQKLVAGNILVEKELTAYQAKDASLRIKPTGGTVTYMYHWYRNIDKQWKSLSCNEPILKQVERGWYEVQIFDKNNCKAAARILFEHGFSEGVPPPQKH